MRAVIRALLLVFPAFLVLSGAGLPAPAWAWEEENRTVNRTVLGIPVTPDWIYNRPDHYEFLPLVSNHDPQHQHPAAWEGQDWDTARWNSAWTPDKTLRRFFVMRIFERQAMRGDVPVLVLGPTFYKLSDLDQRRALKLLCDQSGVFAQGHAVVQLVDWSSADVVGTYMPQQGMMLY